MYKLPTGLCSPRLRIVTFILKTRYADGLFGSGNRYDGQWW
jgi:hypothetical protein